MDKCAYVRVIEWMLEWIYIINELQDEQMGGGMDIPS